VRALDDVHRGPQAPRCYRFPAREIARTRGRLAGGGESRHGQLAADWVEVFAPVVFAAHAPASWRELFAGLPGAPGRIVCDAHSGMLKVIAERWPQTEVYLREWHLRHALERLLVKIGGDTAEQLLPRTEAAFAGQHFWARFDVEARQLDDDRMNAWLERWSPIIASQLARRPTPRTSATGWS
jgi:hypothetical protein